MNYTLQIHGERCLYQVPPGLYELMSNMSREVLRDQPHELYKYIANYLDTLLKLRTNMNKACEVVANVIAENQELFAYVDDLGMTWEEANHHARVLQRALRRYSARKSLEENVRREKEKQMKKVTLEEHSPSFIEYFESLGVDYDTANKASFVLQSAFKTFLARKKRESMDRGSTHTIDMVKPHVDVPSVSEKPKTRNSKLQVYEESPAHSVSSSQYKVQTDKISGSMKEKRSVASATSKFFVYEHSPTPSADPAWHATQRAATAVSSETRRALSKNASVQERDAKPLHTSPTPTMESQLPSYFDTDQTRVQMISDTGRLIKEDDIVTLFSTDSIKVSTKSPVGSTASLQSQRERASKVPSMKNLGKEPSKSDSEKAKELFGMIGDSASQRVSAVSNTVGVTRLSLRSSDHQGGSSTQTSADIIAASFHGSEVSRHSKTSSRVAKLQIKLSDDLSPESTDPT